jgi:hypothetical protein
MRRFPALFLRLWLLAALTAAAVASAEAQQRNDPPRRAPPGERGPAERAPAEPSRPPADTATAADTQGSDRTGARGGAAASDTILEALKRLPGFTVMEYRGDSATYLANERVLRLFGPAEVNRQGDRLTASDTIIYRDANRMVQAYGSPELTGQSQTVQGEVMYYDVETQRARVVGGRTKVAEGGAQWFVRGDVTAEGSDRIFATRSIFTTDDREDPAYYFEADRIKVIRDRILVGRPARLYFRNVPVFWLPFVAQDLTRGRRSGLLAPEFSVNDIVRNNSTPAGARGTGRQISNLGFYWAVNEYVDAQLSGAWRSGDYTGLRGALRYRWNSQFLDGNLSYTQFWREIGSRELQFNASNSWRPDERTNMSLNANFGSTSFLREITTDYFRSTQNITSNLKLNRRFDWGTVDVGANRQQSVANDQVTMDLPTVGLVLQPITFFRAMSPEQQRWYSNATLSLSGSGSRGSTMHGPTAPRRLRDEERTRAQVNQSFTMGQFGLSSSFSLNRTLQPEVPALDSLPLLPRLDRDQGDWNASLSYRIPLVAETSVSPTLSLSQMLRRDSLTAGTYQSAPTRLSFGAGMNTSLYGFLPGFGPFETIRHKLTPSVSYSYVPSVQMTPEQERIFGRMGGRMQNNLTLGSLNQTFEAKLRDSGRPPADTRRPQPGAGGAEGADILAADTPATGEPAEAQAPPEPRKVTLLSINTSGFNFDFARDTVFADVAPPFGREVAGTRMRGFTTRQVTNTFSSDYMRGLQITMAHDLFDQSAVPIADQASTLGRFSPRLSALQTQFSLGQDSPFLRWLGLGGRVREAGELEQDSIPTQPLPSEPLDPTRRGAFTTNPQAFGRGPWRLDIGYTLYRPRDGGLNAHDLQLGMSFAPTVNWAVNWHTNYSIEDGSFGGHRITLRRDLYRWEANFNFSRTPYGNTSFDVLIRLKDLPDLKVDYREDNIGGARRGF